MKKRDFLHQPVAIGGKVVFEFFNNDDENFKTRTLQDLAKALRKELNVACMPVDADDAYIENPERGALAYSLVGITKEAARHTQEKVMSYLDQHAQGRIVAEDSDLLELF